MVFAVSHVHHLETFVKPIAAAVCYWTVNETTLDEAEWHLWTVIDCLLSVAATDSDDCSYLRRRVWSRNNADRPFEYGTLALNALKLDSFDKGSHAFAVAMVAHFSGVFMELTLLLSSSASAVFR